MNYENLLNNITQKDVLEFKRELSDNFYKSHNRRPTNIEIINEAIQNSVDTESIESDKVYEILGDIFNTIFSYPSKVELTKLILQKKDAKGEIGYKLNMDSYGNIYICYESEEYLLPKITSKTLLSLGILPDEHKLAKELNEVIIPLINGIKGDDKTYKEKVQELHSKISEVAKIEYKNGKYLVQSLDGKVQIYLSEECSNFIDRISKTLFSELLLEKDFVGKPCSIDVGPYDTLKDVLNLGYHFERDNSTGMKYLINPYGRRLVIQSKQYDIIDWDFFKPLKNKKISIIGRECIGFLEEKIELVNAINSKLPYLMEDFERKYNDLSQKDREQTQLAESKMLLINMAVENLIREYNKTKTSDGSKITITQEPQETIAQNTKSKETIKLTDEQHRIIRNLQDYLARCGIAFCRYLAEKEDPKDPIETIDDTEVKDGDLITTNNKEKEIILDELVKSIKLYSMLRELGLKFEENKENRNHKQAKKNKKSAENKEDERLTSIRLPFGDIMNVLAVDLCKINLPYTDEMINYYESFYQSHKPYEEFMPFLTKKAKESYDERKRNMEIPIERLVLEIQQKRIDGILKTEKAKLAAEVQKYISESKDEEKGVTKNG